MVASLLQYKKFLNTLNRTRFQLNSYDTCVENIIVNSNKQTIFFHVEYWKLIHQYSKVNDVFINTLLD